MRPPSVSEIDKRMGRIAEKLGDFVGVRLKGDTLVEFAGLLVSVCPNGGKPLSAEQASALSHSLEHLEDGKFALPVLKSNAMRVIANWYLIRDGVPVPSWNGTPTSGYAVFLGIDRANIPGEFQKYWLKIKLKTGIIAGIITWVLLTDRAIARFLDHIAGTGRYHCSIEEISGMHAMVTVEETKGQVRITELSCNDAQKKFNRALSEARSDIQKCSRNIPCNVCSKDVRQCSLAVWLRKEN